MQQPKTMKQFQRYLLERNHTVTTFFDAVRTWNDLPLSERERMVEGGDLNACRIERKIDYER